MPETQSALRAHLPTIRSRLILLVMACILPASLMIVGMIAYGSHEDRVTLAQSSLGTARALMSTVDRDLAGVQAGLLALATSPHLASDDLAAFYVQAEEVLKTLKANNILLIDASFQQRLNTLRPYGTELPTILNPQLRSVFSTGEPIITDLYVGRVANQFITAIGVPVRQGGTIRYILGAGILPERFASLLAEQRFDPDIRAAIFDGTGTIVARTHEMDTFIGRKGNPTVVARLGEVAEDAVDAISVEGIPVLSVFSRSSFSNWSVTIGIPKQILNQGLWQKLTWLVIGLVILLAGSLALAWEIGSQIAGAIRKLAAPALALGSGVEVTVPRLDLREADEVGWALTRASAMLMAAQHKASHDPLTGLANRTLFNDILTHQLAICVRTNRSLSIVNIDLDGFKPVNDEHGHATGDEVLSMVAARLKHAIRDSDLAARLGGDEFALILIHTGQRAAEGMARKLIEALSVPYEIGPVTLELSASIGIASYPDAGTTGEALSQHADQAMYTAKALGKRRYCTYGGECGR
ncbi:MULTISPECIES: sensor domain-containing diguanylate cyclase [Rhodomicrobium]|uniref:sensor domain-containing diguanylate cyclase n=1 Tax=Rhodomicrobium TaxID=1068 RepID=UPI000B4BBD86|nr:MULTISPECIES: sensor domain-containing diguanylate cyclase [Rhodomicrobium]